MQRRSFFASLLALPIARTLDIEKLPAKVIPPTPLAILNYPQTGNVTYGETALSVIGDALREIGALGIDELPCQEDAEFALRKLRRIAGPYQILSGSPGFGLQDIVAASLVDPLAESLRIPFGVRSVNGNFPSGE